MYRLIRTQVARAALKSLLQLKVAHTVCVPAASEEVASSAWLPVKATGDPAGAPSIENCTVPVDGLPDPLPVPVTAAVKVTFAPKVDGLSDELTATLVVLASTD